MLYSLPPESKSVTSAIEQQGQKHIPIVLLKRTEPSQPLTKMMVKFLLATS